MVMKPKDMFSPGVAIEKVDNQYKRQSFSYAV